MTKPLLPPQYITVPVGIVYDKSISPVVRDTYIQIRGMAWGDEDNETPELSVNKLCELTGKSRATIYGHLAILRDSGWLLFSSAHHSGLTVRFVDAVHYQTLSRNLDLLNEDVNLTDLSLTRIVKHPPVNKKNRAGSVQKSGQVSENLDSRNNGWHEVIDDELAELLDRVGVFREKFIDVESSGWETWQLRKLAETVLEELGAGNGGGVFLYRLINRKPPESEEDYRRAYVAGDWSAYVEH